MGKLLEKSVYTNQISQEIDPLRRYSRDFADLIKNLDRTVPILKIHFTALLSQLALILIITTNPEESKSFFALKRIHWLFLRQLGISSLCIDELHAEYSFVPYVLQRKCGEFRILVEKGVLQKNLKFEGLDELIN